MGADQGGHGHQTITLSHKTAYWAQILALPLARRLDQLLNLSEPLFSSLQNGDDPGGARCKGCGEHATQVNGKRAARARVSIPGKAVALQLSWAGWGPLHTPCLAIPPFSFRFPPCSQF